MSKSPRVAAMSPRARAAYIERLRQQHGTGRKRRSPVEFPDLSCATTDGRVPAPLSNAFTTVEYGRHNRPLPPDAQQFPVGHSHKQPLELITPGMIRNGELKNMGGKKT